MHLLRHSLLLLALLWTGSGMAKDHFATHARSVDWSGTATGGGVTNYILNYSTSQFVAKAIDEVYLKIQFKDGETVSPSRLQSIRYGTLYNIAPSQCYTDTEGKVLHVWYGFQDLGHDAGRFIAAPDDWVLTLNGTNPIDSVQSYVSYHSTDIQEMPSLVRHDNLKVATLAGVANELSNGIVQGQALSASKKKLIVMIHGWNPEALNNPYAPSPPGKYGLIYENRDAFSWHDVSTNLLSNPVVKQQDWTVARYDWHEDAATGPKFSTAATQNGDAARDGAAAHGLKLGDQLAANSPTHVQFISHSAGNWMARMAAARLKEVLGASVTIEITSLDPFVHSGTDFNLKPIFEMMSQWTNFRENYFSSDITDGVSGGYTSNTFTNRPATGQTWINQELENLPADIIRDPDTGDYFYGHSTPISWYARTILPINLSQSYLIANNLGFANSLAIRNASPNDSFSAAEDLGTASSGARVWFSYRATGQFLEPNPGLKSVWGTWTAPADGAVTFNTHNSSFYTSLASYTGSSVSALTSLVSDNAGGKGPGQAEISFPVTLGTVYRIAVDGLTTAESGKIELAWNFTSSGAPPTTVALTAPANNATVSGSATVTAESAGASKVDFYLDGELQATDSSTPYSWSWDTTKSANGSHTLLVKAYTGSTLLGSSAPRTAQVSNVIVHDSDEFEPNNSSLQATSVALGSPINGRVSSPSDVDWFKVTLTTPGILSVALTVPAGKDYDLEMYGPNSSWVAGSYNNTGLAESIVYHATVPGIYWIRTYGYPVGHGAFSTTAAYSLTASLNPGTIALDVQPVSVSVPYGAAATFTAHATNTTGSTLSYQWYRNGSAITGAIGSTYTAPPTQLANSGDQYHVLVTTQFGSTPSQVATLSVSNTTTIQWTGAVSTNWNEPLNWDLQRVPTTNDVVRIYAGQVVNLSGSASGTVVLSGTLNWTDGTITGTVTLAAGAVLNISSVGTKYLSGGVLSNGGTVNWGGGGIQLNYSAVVNNLAGGTFNILSASSMTWNQGSQPPTFNNAGTLRKSTDSGTASISSVTFNNTGLVELLSGSMTVSGTFNNDGMVSTQTGVFTMSGGTSNGTFHVASGAVNMLSGSLVFGTQVSFTGAGANQASGSLVLNGAYGFQGLEYAGGVSGTFTLNGSMTLTSGTISGVASIGSGGVLNLSGVGTKYFSSVVFNNGGTVNWSGGGGVQLNHSSVFNNLAGGVFNILNASSMTWNQGSQPPTFNNAGTLRKSTDSGTASISSIIFNNTGLVEVLSGTFSINGSNGSSNGTFSAASGAAIHHASMIFTDGSNFTGLGVNRIVGTVTMNGSQTSQNLELAGGSIGGVATIGGVWAWTSGTINGVLTTASGSVLNLSGGSTKYVSGGVFNNGGMTNWSGGGNLQLNYTTVFNNLAGGTFNILSSSSISWNQGSQPPTFNNAGTIDVQAGVVSFSGFNPNFTTGSVLTGAGHFGGTLNLTGNMTMQNFELIDGNTLSGSGTIAGTFSWLGGTITGTVTLAAGAVLNISSVGTKYLSGGVLSNGGTVNWGGGGIQLNYSAVVNNLAGGTFNILSASSMTWNQGSQPPTFNNAGTLRKSTDSGTASISSVTFNNTGLVESQVGTLSFSSYVQTAGATTLAGGNLSAGSFTINGGMIGGTGTLTGAVSNSGQISPGASPGILTISGSYTQTSTGSINLEIGGATPGSQHDRLVVTGSATLNGTVNAQLINGYQPAQGSNFQVMSFGSRSGSFTGYNGMSIHEDLRLTGNLSSTSLTLTAALSPFNQWKLSRFGAGSDPMISGSTAAPDGDGVANLLKYALHLPSNASALSGLPAVTTSPDQTTAQPHLSLTFKRRIGDSGLRYAVEVSDSLSAWDSSGTQTEQIGPAVPTGDGVTERVTVRLKQPVSSMARKFMRLAVSFN